MSTPPDAVAVVLPVHNAADRVGPVVAGWAAYLRTTGRDYAIVVVDDGSTDGTPEAVDKLRGSTPHLTLLRHDARRGYGACLRTALPACPHPLLFATAADYPYTPADLGKLLKRIGETADVYGEQVPIRAVSGTRTGRPVPLPWRAVGGVYRVFCRVALGVTPDRLPGWLGFREHLRSWWVWLLMGVPLTDVNSAFKLYRRADLDRFPIQSDGDFVHAEIFAKLTFLTSVVAEEQLTPSPAAGPPTWWADFWRVFRDARFHPALPDLSQPPAPPPAAEPVPTAPPPPA
jgi:glycosyltransferase involved in cell wall biosynthesis